MSKEQKLVMCLKYHIKIIMNDKTELDDLLKKKDKRNHDEMWRDANKEEKSYSQKLAKKQKKYIEDLFEKEGVLDRISQIVYWMNENLFFSFKITKSKFILNKFHSWSLSGCEPAYYEISISRRVFFFYKKIIWIYFSLCDGEVYQTVRKPNKFYPVFPTNSEDNKLAIIFRDKDKYNTYHKYKEHIVIEDFESFFDFFKDYVVRTFQEKK